MGVEEGVVVCRGCCWAWLRIYVAICNPSGSDGAPVCGGLVAKFRSISPYSTPDVSEPSRRTLCDKLDETHLLENREQAQQLR